MKSLCTKLLFATLIGVLYFAASASAATKRVNCDHNQTISNALETATGSADLLEITVSGQCNETVTIRRDRVWITGDPFTQINGTVRVFSSNNVRFFDLTISGPGEGMVVSGSQVSTNGVHLVNNDGTGLAVRRHSHIWFRNGMIIGNCENIEDADCDDGVSVENASLELLNTSISNSRYGIIADVGAHVVLVTNEDGITEIKNNSVAGVQVALNSLVDLIGDTNFYGNRHHSLYALQGSAVRISSPNVDVAGNIGCQDWQSFLTNPGGGDYYSTSCPIL